MSCLLGACIVSAQLLSGGMYTEQTQNKAIDAANVTHNISHFYEVENQQFKVDGYLILDTGTRIDIGYDNGLESQKRTRSQALTLGITQLNFIDNDSYIAVGVSTKLGGRVTEIPCTDDSGMNRQFFCDNLATLQPFSQPKYVKSTKVSIKYNHKFNWGLGKKI
jgi:hypothetical protein